LFKHRFNKYFSPREVNGQPLCLEFPIGKLQTEVYLLPYEVAKLAASGPQMNRRALRANASRYSTLPSGG